MNRISATAKIDAVLSGSQETIETSAAEMSHNNKHTNGHKMSKKLKSKSRASDKVKLHRLKKLKHMQEKLLKQQQQQKKSLDNEVNLSFKDSDVRVNGSESKVLNKIDSQLISELHKMTS